MTSALARFVENHGRTLMLVFLGLALAGVAVIPQIPISIFPQTDFPRVVILVDNGIAPVNVQMLTVTRPIEEAIRLVPGVTTIRSVTGRGSTEINVFFRWNIDIRNALNLIQGRISQIQSTLPADSHFYINRLTFSVFPMIGFSMTSPTRPLTDLWERAYYTIVPRLYQLPGVAEAKIVGGRPPEFHVVPDPQKLNAYNFPITKLSDAIRNTNIIAPDGMLQENHHLYLTTVNDLMQTEGDIEDTVVDVVKGTPVRIRDLARVVPSERPTYNIVTANGKDSVLVNVMQQPDGNAVTIADAVNAELRAIRRTLPKDIDLSIFYDQSILVRQSIDGVTESIIIGLFLSIAVLFAFLKNWRMTIVASAVIPIAALIAIIFMQLFELSFNLMTLGGIAACIGVVIDDAIVMVENIAVYLSMGKSPSDASLTAIRELTPALIGSTLTPIMVFVPLVFLTGITAVFFKSLALTLVTALFASLLLAIFFTPVFSLYFLRTPKGNVETDYEKAEQAGEGRLMRWITNKYESLLSWSLKRPIAILAGGLAVLAVSIVLYKSIGSGFLPEMDEGAFVIDYRMPAGASLQETDRVLRHVEALIRQTPEVESYSRRTGARLALAIAEPNRGDFLVKLKQSRERSEEEIINGLRQQITRSEPVLSVEFPHILEDLVGDLVWSPQPIEIKIFNPDDKLYKQAASEIAGWLPHVRGIVDVVNQTIVIGPSIDFRVDPAKAGRAGFTVSDVANAGASLLDGQLASNMIRGDREYGIRVRYPATHRQNADDLKNLLITSPNGVTLPLSSVAQTGIEQNQTEIHRENLRNMSSVTARLEGRDLGTAMDEIKARLFKEVSLPPGTDVEFGGLYQVQQESFAGLTRVLLASILLIFIVLAFEFRSFSHPTAILAATILCTSGALAALLCTGMTLNIASFMGIIMVIGIVQKNGILLLDFEKHFSAQGYSLRDAVFHAGRRRLRPILMTALGTMFGMLPLALGVGHGAQLLQPLAIAVLGGVAVSMVLSLFVTPILFLMLRRSASNAPSSH
jgi:CzcA family heavy metal efflux pump